MRFLIDADCPKSVGKLLKQKGYDVIDIRDIDAAASDNDIYRLIKKESRILITRDTDFGNILRYPVAPNCGIILLRVYLIPTKNILELITQLLKKVKEKDLLGSLVVATINRLRIRRF